MRPILFTDMDSSNPADNNTIKYTGLPSNSRYVFLIRCFQRFEMNVASLESKSVFVYKLENKSEILKLFEFAMNSEELLSFMNGH